MGIRETLNDNPRLVTRITVAMLVFSAVYIAVQLFVDRRDARLTLRDFYSVDDGATYFPDDATRFSPFEVRGRLAYRCRVFTCENSTPFVGYLERYPPEVIATINRLRADSSKKAELDNYLASASRLLEYKRPGGESWIPLSDADRLRSVLTVLCPDGKPATPVNP